MRKKNLTDINNEPVEPTYVPAGEEFGKQGAGQRPKWQRATTDFEKNILSSVNRVYFLEHSERSNVITIEKGMIPLSSGIISVYPTEWVQNCIDWVLKKRREGNPIPLMALLNLINNQDRKEMFIADWKTKNPGIALHKNIDDSFKEDEIKPMDDETHLEI